MTSTEISMEKSEVYEQIQDALDTFSLGIGEPTFPWLEDRYKEKFRKPLDYTSLNVTGIGDLLEQMREKNLVMLVPRPSPYVPFYVSLRMIGHRRDQVKLNVHELLSMNSREIMFSSFEKSYEDLFMADVPYIDCALTNLDSLCDAFKDILVVGENSAGEKFMALKEGIPTMEVESPSGEKVKKKTTKEKVKKAVAKIIDLVKRRK